MCFMSIKRYTTSHLLQNNPNKQNTSSNKNHFIFNNLNVNDQVNPNCTGQGQTWPRQLWCQIPDKNSYISEFKKNTCSCKKRLPNLFQLLTLPHKMTYWHPFWCIFIISLAATTPCWTPPLPLGFTAITDHPRAGEVPPDCGLQSSAAPIGIPISFWSWATQNAGSRGFSASVTVVLYNTQQKYLARWV